MYAEYHAEMENMKGELEKLDEIAGEDGMVFKRNPLIGTFKLENVYLMKKDFIVQPKLLKVTDA